MEGIPVAGETVVIDTLQNVSRLSQVFEGNTARLEQFKLLCVSLELFSRGARHALLSRPEKNEDRPWTLADGTGLGSYQPTACVSQRHSCPMRDHVEGASANGADNRVTARRRTVSKPVG